VVRPRHVLVVEDDEGQRANLSDLLRSEGYAVTEAANAEDALGLLQSQSFDLLVTDYQLSGATGTWLARVAGRSLQAGAPQTLLITGHSQISDGAGLRVLRKPLDAEVFLREVQQTLAHPPGDDTPRPTQRIALILYVNESLPSRRALAALQSVLSDYNADQVALTVVNLARQVDHQAEEHRVVATPTLVKTFPAPRVWITGELQPDGILKRLLDQAGVDPCKR
jgi:CheY-like chemotaxis protein